MESLILMIHELQELAIGDEDIEPPRIVLVGIQGSGKSSVLESLVGRSFLPKGTGVVTRTPLVLHLVHSPQHPEREQCDEDGTLDAEEYGVFLHTDAIFTDFDDISGEIQRQSEKIAGTDKGIGEKEITLKLYSPRLADMTLVDLPGLTELPVGDQPHYVGTRIRNLVLKYVENPYCIIMVVLTVNNDVATNEGLKLAKDVDPKGERTLVVLTKVDLMDAGTDATDILEGRVVPVKLGIVAVVNRSHEDIGDKKPIEQVYEHEAQFFRTKYPTLADTNGTSFLLVTLKKLLMEPRKDYLQDVATLVEFKIPQIEALVDFYSDDQEDQDRGLSKIIRHFSSEYSEEIWASATKLKKKTCECSRARIYDILHETFRNELYTIFGYSDQKIDEKMSYSSDPEAVLQRLLDEHVERLQEASLGCAKLVYEGMQQSLKKCASSTELVVQFSPELLRKIKNLIKKLLRSQLSLVETVIREQIFFSLSRRIVLIRCRDTRGEVVNKEEYEKESEDEKRGIIAKLWQSYKETAIKTLHDDVTARVMDHMVTEVRNYLQHGLLKDLVHVGAGRTYLDFDDYSEDREGELNILEALYKARDMIAQCKAYY